MRNLCEDNIEQRNTLLTTKNAATVVESLELARHHPHPLLFVRGALRGSCQVSFYHVLLTGGIFFGKGVQKYFAVYRNVTNTSNPEARQKTMLDALARRQEHRCTFLSKHPPSSASPCSTTILANICRGGLKCTPDNIPFKTSDGTVLTQT